MENEKKHPTSVTTPGRPLPVTPPRGVSLPSGPLPVNSSSASGKRPASVRQSGPQPALSNGHSSNAPEATRPSGLQSTISPEFRAVLRDYKPAPKATPVGGIRLPDSPSNVPLRKTPIRLSAAKPPSTIMMKPSSGKTQKIGWICQCCRAKLTPESFIQNEAVIHEGMPLCLRCIRDKRNRRIKKAAAIAGTVCLLAATGVCLFALRRDTSPEALGMRALKDARSALQIAQTGNYADADRRVKVLVAKTESGACTDKEINALARNADNALKERLKAEYGAISPKEQEVLMFIEGNYSGAAGHPLRAIHIDDANAATITIALAEAPSGKKITGGIRTLLDDLLTRFPKLQSVKACFLYGKDGGPLAEAGYAYADRITIASGNHQPNVLELKATLDEQPATAAEAGGIKTPPQ